jgi:hypothetical protein
MLTNRFRILKTLKGAAVLQQLTSEGWTNVPEVKEANLARERKVPPTPTRLVMGRPVSIPKPTTAPPAAAGEPGEETGEADADAEGDD